MNAEILERALGVLATATPWVFAAMLALLVIRFIKNRLFKRRLKKLDEEIQVLDLKQKYIADQMFQLEKKSVELRARRGKLQQRLSSAKGQGKTAQPIDK